MYRPNENENCGSCKNSYIPDYPPLIVKKSHLVACSLGRDVLRTRESYCTDWKKITKPIWAEL